MNRRSLTERIARASARRPWLTLAVWGVVVAAALVVVFAFFSDLSASDSFTGNPESERADKLISEHLPGANLDTEIIVVRNPDLTVDDAAVKTVVDGLKADISAIGSTDIASVITYYDAMDGGDAQVAAALVSSDRHATIVPVTLTAGSTSANQHIQALYELVKDARARGLCGRHDRQRYLGGRGSALGRQRPQAR
jgi:uncharacterized membrane protein YdfJ with MMPL/SSD domain